MVCKTRRGQTRTVNSPVTASNPTWMVCSKSEGEEISGLSLSRSFFRPPAGKGQCAGHPRKHEGFYTRGHVRAGVPPFSEANMEMILFLGFFSSGTDGSGREL